jgi:hypothetical protein
MPFKYTNKDNISLPLAVWLMHDSYDYDKRENVISATSLLKPTRALTLIQQNKGLDKTVDIMNLVSARMGSAIHAIAEEAWTDRHNITKALETLQMSNLDNKVVINPQNGGHYTKDYIPVYVEQRHEKEIDGFIISGKYDLVVDGTVSDYKSTSVWTYIFDSNALKYTQQGSIYKWLAPDRIKDTVIEIHYIFTDWSSSQAARDPKYPQTRVITKEYPLWSLDQTEHYIRTKLKEFKGCLDKSQNDLPQFTKEELWESDTKYKYYKNPAKMARATKNYDTLDEANARLAIDGRVGTVVTVPGEVKACRYCEVSDICEQAQNLIQQGRLVL